MDIKIYIIRNQNMSSEIYLLRILISFYLSSLPNNLNREYILNLSIANEKDDWSKPKT
jgi:hypothetical protein